MPISRDRAKQKQINRPRHRRGNAQECVAKAIRTKSHVSLPRHRCGNAQECVANGNPYEITCFTATTQMWECSGVRREWQSVRNHMFHCHDTDVGMLRSVSQRQSIRNHMFPCHDTDVGMLRSVSRRQSVRNHMFPCRDTDVNEPMSLHLCRGSQCLELNSTSINMRRQSHSRSGTKP